MLNKSTFLFVVTISLMTVTSAEDVELPNDQEDVIVVLGKVPRLMTDVVGSTTLISSETIEKELAHNLTDLVRYQAGISIENSGTRFGSSGFSIRGIGGNRITTEIDGIPVADQFSIGSYSNSGRSYIDTDLIQQVEILRGPASSIYGSDAIGGVVSFITKKPVDLLSQTEQDIYLGLKTGYYSVDNSQLFSASTAFTSDNSSALLSVSSRKGHEYDNQAITGAGLDIQDNESQSFLAKYFLTLSDNHELIFSYDYFNRQAQTDVNSFIGQGRFRSTTGLTGDDESKRENISLNYEFVVQNDWLDGGVIRLYQQKTETEQLTDETRFSRGVNYLYDRDFYYQQDINGLRLNFYAHPSTVDYSHTIGYGFEWSKTTTTELREGVQTNLDTGSSTNVILSEQFPLRDFPISDVTEMGIYINDEVKINDTAWSFVPAIRFDHYKLTPKPDTIYLEDNMASDVVSISESSVTPKLGIVYQSSENSQFYAQYIRGFRAPPFEDANIGLDIPMFSLRAIPNPDLKSETSDGFELGYSYSNGDHRFEATGFYNNYKDFIQTKVNLGFDPVSGFILFQSQNIEKAKIHGVEMSYQYGIDNWLSQDDELTASVSLFISEGSNKTTAEPLNSIEPGQLLVGLQWQSPEQKWSISLNTTLVDSKDDVDETTEELFKTSGYATFDLISNFQISDNAVLSLAINNLSDRKYWRWSDVNGMSIDDPVIESLSAAGINGSLQLKVNW